MASSKVIVVTNAELGWDCVVGVFDADSVTENQLLKTFPGEYYHFDERTVETNIQDYE